MIMMTTPVAILFLRPSLSPKKDVQTEPRKHPTFIHRQRAVQRVVTEKTTFINGHDQPNNLGARRVEGGVECIAADQTTKESVVTKLLSSAGLAPDIASLTIL